MPEHSTRTTAGRLRLLGWLLLTTLLAACGAGDEGAENDGDQEQQRRATLISVVAAEPREVEVVERTIGRITSRTAPAVAAEVSGRILTVHVDAGDRVERGDLLLEVDPEPYQLAQASARTEIRRLEVTIANQERELRRNRELLEDGFVTQSAVDNAEAELAASREQLEAAKVQLDTAERDLRNARVTAPVDGEIDERNVSNGDYIAPGEPLFRLVSQDLLQVRLPFPETVAGRLERGQPVRLRAPLSGDGVVTGEIRELRPGLLGTSRAIEAIVDVTNPGNWRQGGSVNAEVVVTARENVVVPTSSVVQRPAGEVVYVVEDGIAHARDVEVGRRGSDGIEILSGVEPGETVAVDGAGFLTDGAPVRTAEDD